MIKQHTAHSTLLLYNCEVAESEAAAQPAISPPMKLLELVNRLWFTELGRMGNPNMYQYVAVKCFKELFTLEVRDQFSLQN